MNIFDLGLGERLSEGILAELGMPSRAWELPHVGQRRDLIAFEKPAKFFDAPGGVANRPDCPPGVRHSVSGQSLASLRRFPGLLFWEA